MDSISEDLLVAYRATHFHVFSEQPFVLRIGEYSDELNELHKAAGVSSSVFITAFNPFSVPCSNEKNLRAQSRLIESINQLGLVSIEGEGKDPKGKWPGEPSKLVLGCQNTQAKELGTLYGQNAIIWCGDDAIPELVLLVGE